MKVLLVEDVAEFREKVSGVLRARYGAESVLEAGTCDEARRQMRSHPGLKLAVIDLGLPDGNGTELIAELSRTHPDTLLVVATIYDDDAHLFPALSAGAHGYLLKDLPADEWLGYLEKLENGMPALSPSIARRLLQHFRAPTAPVEDAVKLTPRESEVLRLIGRGLTVGEAAKVMQISDNTVAGYIKEIYRKLNISSRAEAALEAAKRGLT